MFHSNATRVIPFISLYVFQDMFSHLAAGQILDLSSTVLLHENTEKVHASSMFRYTRYAVLMLRPTCNKALLNLSHCAN